MVRGPRLLPLTVVSLSLFVGACGRSAPSEDATVSFPDTVALPQTLPMLAPPTTVDSHRGAQAEPAEALRLEIDAPVPTDPPPPPLRAATLSFTGDTLIHSPLVEQAAQNANGIGFDFAPMFWRVAGVLSAADLAVCHLETPIAPPGQQLSTFPRYGVPSEIAPALAAAGYDRCSTASNHTIDRGVEGIDATVTALEVAGITQDGMARTPDEATSALIDVNGIEIAHLSYTSNFNGAHLPEDQVWRSRVIDLGSIFAAATDARARGADVVVLSLHWGTETRSSPNQFQLDVANAITLSGTVDLIVGHHAHVIQPIASVNGVWVVYGMGNFLSNMPTGAQWPASSQDGMIVTVDIAEQTDGTFAIGVPDVTPTWVDRDNGFAIRPVLQDLADPTTPASIKSNLLESLGRTSAVVGEFINATPSTADEFG